MCSFCEGSQEEFDEYIKWTKTDLYQGDPQVYDDLRFFLEENGTFHINAKYDGGYISAGRTLKFRYCPLCWRSLK